MNKKFKIKRIKWGIFILLCFVASGLTYSAYATQVTKINDSSAQASTSSAEVADGGAVCTKNKGTCEKANIISVYNPQITSNYNESTGHEDITIKIKKTTTASSFYYIIAYYEKGTTGYSVLKDGYLTNTDNQITYSVPTYKAANVEVVLALESSEADAAKCTTTTKFEIYPHANQKAAIDEYLNSLDTQNPVVDKIDNKKCRYALFLTAGVQIEPVEVPSEENESLKEGGLCNGFVSGKCGVFDSIEGISSTDNLKSRCEKYNPTNGTEVTSVGSAKMNAYYKDAVEYCYSSSVDVNYSDKDVATMISNAVTSYIVDNADYTSTGDKLDVKDAIEKDPKETIELKCALDKVPSTYANTQETYEYQEEKKYYVTKPDEEDSTSITSSTGKTYTCKKNCQEVVTVKYGPPVAVKAGLCFEYQVKIESKVTCNSEFSDEPKPKKSDYDYCTPTPHCNDSSKYYDQAGPTEEFDSCINKCDGGKYTQSCIDKCYSKVYGTATALDVNYTEKTMAKQISDKKLYNKKAYSVSSSDADVKELMKTVKNNENCKYKRNKTTGAIYWDCTNDAQGWETYGRYYFQTISKTKETIKEDLVSGNGEIRCFSSGRCKTWYYEGVSGFKRACENSDCTKHCGESCQWIGCSSAKYLNPKEALDAYNADLEAYNTARGACSTSVSCNTEQTTYTIKVDNKVKSGASPNNKTYKATVTNKVWSSAGDPQIIIGKDYCYSEDSTNTKQYMTEWSVPSSWINNKTGEISYEDKVDNKTWTKKENQFCTSLSSDNVNEKWWNWRVKGLGTVSKADIEWNIIAQAKDFGKFNWNFQISCFYAAYDDPIETCETPPCDSSCTTPPCETEKTLSYRVRSVDNSDLFPSADSEDTKTYSYADFGRTPGFNWSNAATDLRNLKYEITPGALMQEIQRKGTQIYSNKDELDYEFELDRETLMKLATTPQKEKDGQFNYNHFSGITVSKNDIMVYKSDLIRTIANKTVPTVLGCNNRRDSANCETFSNDYVDTIRTRIGGK